MSNLQAKVLACCALFLLARPLPAQLLNSWEGGLEGWSARNGAVLANSGGGAGVTDGSDSLSVTVPNDGFLRYGARSLDAAALSLVAAAAANPLLHRLEFDVTYDPAQIPQGSVTFVSQQIAVNSNRGWSQIDFGDISNGMTNETQTFFAHFSRLRTIASDISSLEILLAANGNWGAAPATFYLDNLRIAEIAPDLDQNGQIDPSDWSLFIEHHKADLSGRTAAERFWLGDLDSDGDNDFADLLIFEAGYDQANGVGAFRQLVPEPAAWAGWLALLACWSFRRRGRGQAALLGLAACLLFPLTTRAQLLHSWEDGLEGWAVTSFSAVPVTLGNGTIGATDGASSLAITQSEDGFSWNAFVNYGPGSPQFQTLANAVAVGLENFFFELDVTYDTSVIPQTGPPSFLNLSIAMNSSGVGWTQVNGLATASGSVTETVTISEFLSSWNLAPGDATTFYQITIGMNGDWGLDPATVHFDNLRLVQFNEPAVLSLEVDRSTGATRILNAEAFESFPFNYYEVTSPGESLNLAGWNSLDAQDIDAVDGPDAGSVAGDSPLEGWDAAGGASNADLTEAFLLGSSTLLGGQSFSLGNAYQHRRNAEDLVFRYRDLREPGMLQVGNVVYVGTPPPPQGDFDGDGDYACADVDALVAEIVAGTHAAGFDLTGDGLVDGDDLTAWLIEAGAAELPSGQPYLEGDANLDGVVDVSDFNLWNGGKFTAVAAWCAGDFNADGVVDVSDFNIWNGNKFEAAAAISAVPEPVGSLWIGGVFVLSGLACRRSGRQAAARRYR